MRDDKPKTQIHRGRGGGSGCTSCRALIRDRARLHTALSAVMKMFENEVIPQAHYEQWLEAKACLKEISP